MKIDSLLKLYVHELKDLYSAENQIQDELPSLIERTQDESLKAALIDHANETATHIERIETICDTLDFQPGGHRCLGISGLLSEGSELLGEVAEDHVTDAAVISACQRVEHYEMAAYGVARAFARKLGRDADVALLTATLEEEGAADRKLTELAEHHINFVARVDGD